MDEKKVKKIPVLEKISTAIVGGVEHFFYRFGYAIACHPWRFILGCLGLVALSSLGVLRFHHEKHPIKLWIPRTSNFVTDTEWLMTQFREGYRIQSILVTAPNVLDTGVLLKLNEIQKRMKKIDSSGTTWEDLCFRIPVVDFNLARRKRDVNFEKEFEFDPESLLGREMYCRIMGKLDYACMEQSLLEIWKFNTQKIAKLTEPRIIKDLNKTKNSPVFGHPTDYMRLLGGVTRNATGHVVAAKALLSVYMVHVNFQEVDFGEVGNEAGTADWATKSILKWEEKFIEMMENETKHAEGIEVFYEAGRSFADISAASMFQDVDKLVIGIVIMFLFIQLVVSKFNMLECRFLLGTVGLLCIGMAFVVAVGLCSLLGVSYGPVHTALPFLLMGIGVDDMFVIMACWRSLNLGKKKLSLPEKMGQTMQLAGASITITTLTDVAAFLVGSLTIIPSLQSFCIYAAVGVLVTYTFQVTFFVAVFVLDEMRIAQGRNCLLMCYQHHDYQPGPCSEVQYSQRIVKQVYSKAVLSTPGKAIVILLTVGIAVLGIRGNLFLKQKFDPNWFLGESTHLYKFNMKKAEFFPDIGQTAGIYFGNLNYSVELPNIHRLVQQFKEEKDIMKNMEEWYSGFRYYCKQNFKKDISTDLLTDEEFNTYIARFLFTPSGSKYQKLFRFEGDLQCGEPAPAIRVASFEFKFKLFTGPEETLPAMNKIRRLLHEANFTTGDRFATLWGKVLANWVTDEVIDTELYRNLALACVCVMVCTAVLIVNFVACGFVFMCVLLTLVDVGGFLYYWGMTIDTTTCIGLQLATGLCVDYAAHICHAFLSRSGSNSDRILETLTDIGPAILSGGFSTLLALSMLATSESYIFTSFFKIFLLIVVFGLFHGTVFLPVMLSLVGPKPYKISRTTEPKSEALRVYSLCDVQPNKEELS